MQETTDHARYGPAQECHPDSEARDEALDVFSDLVRSSFDPSDVEKWVRASPIRVDLFQTYSAGRIRWPRALGRPDTPNLFDGFRITTAHWADIWHLTPEGPVQDFNGWMYNSSNVDLRDGLSDLDYYSIRYLFVASAETANKVEVNLADVPWRVPGRSARDQRRYLSSHGYEFTSGGSFMSLPEITLDSRPFVQP
jgi:hypothetical protein